MASQGNANTVFLTEQETERIRSTVKARLKKCGETKGHERESRNAKDAISQATGASLMADMGGAPDPDMTETKGSGGTLPALSVGQPYPPCTVPLEQLQPMELADLRMDTHHSGRRLHVKRAAPVVILAARSWTMVQDETGKETERLEICLHKSRHDEDVLESTSTFVIREPYFTLTDQGEATIRIDHPSDLVVLRDEVVKENTASTEDAAAAEKLARTRKEKGNSALGQKDFPLAHANYTEGLKIAGLEAVKAINPDLPRDISRNRAHLNLILNQLDEAKEDAKASLIGKEDQKSKSLDSKAYYRAGCAAYTLAEYQEAERCFQEQLKLTPGDKDANAYLRRISARLREQKSGTYDWGKIKTNLSRARSRVDMADFISNTEVRDSPGRGRGLFAARDIAAGELVMCEKAFCVVWSHEEEAMAGMTYDTRDEKIRMSPVGLTRATVQKLLNNPSQIKRFMDLYGDYKGDGKDISSTEDGPVVDVFRVHDIVSRNAFGPGNQYGDADPTKPSSGIWVWAAHINHSCVPSMRNEFIGDLMVFRAARSIKAGEELFFTYTDSSDYDTRQAALMTTWGFQCDCALCDAEKADDPAIRKKRRDLVSEADAFIQREHWAGAKRLVIARAQRIAKGIEDTYDAKRYEGVPKLGAVGIKDWLAKATPRR